MFELYLFFLILGGGLLGFSMLGGGDSGESGDSHLEIDSHSDASIGTGDELELISSAEVGADVHPSIEIHSDVHSGADSHSIQHLDSVDSIKFFSMRNGVYFSAFFGLTGTVLELLAFQSVFTFISAISMGAFSAFFGYKLMKYLKGSESGAMINISSMRGKSAIVTLPIKRGGRGKILINCNGQTEEIPAAIAEASDRIEFNIREKVLVYDIIDNTAQVIEHEF